MFGVNWHEEADITTSPVRTTIRRLNGYLPEGIWKSSAGSTQNHRNEQSLQITNKMATRSVQDTLQTTVSLRKEIQEAI